MSSNVSTYKGKPIGSEWNKWDLHVHTPASVVQHYGDSNRDSTWEEYISALEQLPREIKAIGINDYFFIDGYRRVKKAKDEGRLANLELILPVVELRIASFAGHKKLSKINFHVIFSDELSPDMIESYFLNGLAVDYELDDGKPWRGRVSSKDMLQELGQAIIDATPQSKKGAQSPISVGFANAAFSLDKVREIIGETRFQGKILTAIGITEWDDMRFDSAAAIKRDIINKVDFVFVASPSIDSYSRRKNQLSENGVHTRLLDCSDAHHYATSSETMRLGNVFSWLKADLTFQGLCRVVHCFDDRVDVKAISDAPEKLKRVQENRTKYIRSVEIRKNPESRLEEKWFDCELPLNSGLVAVIGNQGNGKSALTDIIALCGNTKTIGFSFLTKEKFRDGLNKAKEFTATLHWIDDTKSPPKRLDEDVNHEEVERIRYVPQGFFDLVTNETVVKKGGRFYAELEKAVFSHISDSDRLGCADFDDLIKLKTNRVEQSLESLRQELRDLNIKIIEIEQSCSSEMINRIRNEIATKKQEIKAHEVTRPAPVSQPAKSSQTTQEIDQLREQEQQLNEEIGRIRQEIKVGKQSREFLNQKKEGIIEKERQIKEFLDNLQRELNGREIDLKVTEVMSVSVDISPFETLTSELDLTIAENEKKVVADEGSLVLELKRIIALRREREKTLEESNQAYQAYRDAEFAWQSRLTELQGNQASVGSLKWLEQEYAKVTETKPKELQELLNLRRKKAGEIYQRLRQISAIFQELTKPAQDHIESEELTREKYKMRFAIDLVERGLGDKLFSIIKQSGNHTFTGRPDGQDRLSALIEGYDFESSDNAVKFAETLLDQLVRDHRHDSPRPVNLSNILRAGKSVQDVYDLLYGFEYLTTEYSITLNNKPLKQLSPGERGILLLVFYLVIDKGDIPLIIDQPEGNLNNQSIFKNLVPVFKEAKNRRQIIVVTHNPNLAVVCDAEQIIHAKIDFDDGNRAYFDSGSLENPYFTELSLDVLEGTPPAFLARTQTYGVR